MTWLTVQQGEALLIHEILVACHFDFLEARAESCEPWMNFIMERRPYRSIQYIATECYRIADVWHSFHFLRQLTDKAAQPWHMQRVLAAAGHRAVQWEIRTNKCIEKIREGCVYDTYLWVYICLIMCTCMQWCSHLHTHTHIYIVCMCIYIRQMPGLCPEPQPRQATHHHHHHHHQTLTEDPQWM